MQSLEFSIYNGLSSVNRDNFTYSFLIWIPFISFYCLVALARTSCAMLNTSGESGHLYLVPGLKGKAFSFSLFSIMFLGLSCMAFIMLRYIPTIPSLLRSFIMNGY